MKFDRFIEDVAPSVLWTNLFGCSPAESGVVSGTSGSAATAIRTILKQAADGMDSRAFGCPVDLGEIKPDQTLLAKIRDKLFAAVVIETTSARARAAVTDHQGTEFDLGYGNGMITIIGSLDDAQPLLEHIGFSRFSEFVSHGDMVSGQPPICLMNGKPQARVKTVGRNHLISTFERIVSRSILALMKRDKSPDDLAIFEPDASDRIPSGLLFGTEDERDRLNAIIEKVANRIDGHGEDFDLALRSAPFRRTLIQSLAENADAFLREELGRYGLEGSGSILVGQYDNSDAFSPLLYRLLGDVDYHMEGLMFRDLVSSVELSMPLYASDGPTIIMVPPSRHAVSQVQNLYGGTDIAIALWDSSKVIPEDFDVDDVLSVSPSDTEALDETLRILRRKFGFEVLNQEGNPRVQ